MTSATFLVFFFTKNKQTGYALLELGVVPEVARKGFVLRAGGRGARAGLMELRRRCHSSSRRQPPPVPTSATFSYGSGTDITQFTVLLNSMFNIYNVDSRPRRCPLPVAKTVKTVRTIFRPGIHILIIEYWIQFKRTVCQNRVFNSTKKTHLFPDQRPRT